MAVIDIGAAAIGRAGTASGNVTWVGVENPANDTGSITSIEVWFDALYGNAGSVEVATFDHEGSNALSTRDSEALGTVTAGSKQTFAGLAMDVATGDYLGLYFSGGALEFSYTGGSGAWDASGDNIPCSSTTFNLTAGRTISLYGTGETAGVGIPLFMHHYKQMWGNN